MGSAVRSTLYQDSRDQTLCCTKSPPLLGLRREIKDPAANLFIETLFNAACARILRNYAEVRYRFPAHRDSPTIDCVRRSTTSMTISENLSSCVRFLKLPDSVNFTLPAYSRLPPGPPLSSS